MNGLSYKADRDNKGGELILYIRDYIPCRILTLTFTPQIEAITIGINSRKRKWLLIATYNPGKRMILQHSKSIGNKYT